MNNLTYLELLQLVKDGKAPKRIGYQSNIYKWNGKLYVYEFGIGSRPRFEYFGEAITCSSGEMFLANNPVIEVIEQ